MPTGIDDKLLPEAVRSRVVESAIKQSVVLQLATTQPMPAFVEQIPVVTTAPSASWVSASARKPITQVDWSAATLQAEEIAAVTAIPDVYIQDTSSAWKVEESAENELAKAIARALHEAVLFGTNAPSSYPTGGIKSFAGTALTGDDALETIDKTLTALEADGLVASGVASSSAIGSALRKAHREAAALPGQAAANEIYGVPVNVTAPPRRMPSWATGRTWSSRSARTSTTRPPPMASWSTRKATSRCPRSRMTRR